MVATKENAREDPRDPGHYSPFLQSVIAGTHRRINPISGQGQSSLAGHRGRWRPVPMHVASPLHDL